MSRRFDSAHHPTTVAPRNISRVKREHKLRQFVLDQEHIAMPFAIHGMTGLAAECLHLEDRGFLRAGYVADIAVLDRDRIRDLATYEGANQYSEGTVHVLVNGELAIRDARSTGIFAGTPLLRGGRAVKH